MRSTWALILCSLTLAGAGCASAKRDIEAKAEEVRNYAGTIRADAGVIRDNAQDLWAEVPPAMIGKVEEIQAAAGRIDHNAERVGNVAAIITDRAQQVKDITPWWQTLLGMGFWGLTVMGIALVLAWYGLLPIVIRMLAGLAAKVPSLFKLLIPDSIRTSAKLDAEAYDPNDPTMTAAIAARRQADPRYNAAYTVFNQKHKAAK
jgi:Na+-transporting methylmalonyl-CoA/oxaloacetate decarboxylase gamma subunit